MIARAAFREELQELVGPRDADSSQNIYASPLKSVREQRDRRPDQGDMRIRADMREKIVQRVIEERGARGEHDIRSRQYLGSLMGRPEMRQFVRFEGPRIVFQHQIVDAAPLERPQERHEGADDHDPIAVADLGCVEGIDALVKFERGMRPGSAKAFKVAMPTARRRPLAASTSFKRSDARRPRIRPGNGIAIAELGQQTASGMDFTGVAHAPAMPLSSFTPVKKTPMVARSTVIACNSEPRMRRIAAMVSSRIGSDTLSVPGRVCILTSLVVIFGRK
jgi:hypothetical protein